MEDPPGNYDPEQLWAPLRVRVKRIHSRHPVQVNSGWRSSVDQASFFDCAQAKKNTGKCPPGCERTACASANRPGESNHEAVPYGTPRALAVDMEPQDDDWDRFSVICREEALHAPLEQEPWHWQPIEVPNSYYEGMP